jgi:hypothetical protein
VLRPVHVGFVLALAFLSFPVVARMRDRLRWWDWALAAAAAATIVYIVAGGDAYADRATVPSNPDLVVGVTLILLVLEAVRRASGWIMPAVVLGFIVYAMVGPNCRRRGPPRLRHRAPGRPHGHDARRHLRTGGGRVIDVIILFTIFGAFLAHSGAGNFSSIFLGRGDGKTPQWWQRGTVVVPAWRRLRQRSRNHGDAGFGCVSDVGEGGLQKTMPAVCSPPAGWVRSCARRYWVLPPS